MRVQENPERAERDGATTAECPCGAEFVLVPADRFPLGDRDAGRAQCPKCSAMYGWEFTAPKKLAVWGCSP